MADLIDRKELRDALYEADAVIMQGIKIINQFPAVDAVPVVRCKDCVSHNLCKFEQYLGLDGFCSYGGSKEDETD